MEEKHQPYYIHRKVVIRTMLTADYQRTTGLLFPGAFSRSRLLPIRERKTAKIKFVVLVCILAAIVTLIWRSIPT